MKKKKAAMNPRVKPGVGRGQAIVQRIVAELPAGYPAFLEDIKGRIRAAQVQACLAANRELVALYWSIGRDITTKEQTEGWGSKLVNRLADDLHLAFPGLAGFSRGNVYRMRSFYLAYAARSGNLPKPVTQADAEIDAQTVRQPSKVIVAQAARQLAKGISPQRVERGSGGIVAQAARQLQTDAEPPDVIAQIPWGHNILLIERIKDPAVRLWYAHQAIAHGWSRSILALQIESGLHKRQGKAVTNFKATLVPPQSELAQQVLKDPYIFDFLTIAEGAEERAVERDLVTHVANFLLEMGAGFSFVGRQVHLEVDGEDFYVDLLFYHLRLRCFVVIDLKARPFQPEFAGKMNFYLSAVDDLMRHPDDKPSIGLILCREKNRITAEYALRDIRKPIGVADWHAKIVESLPKRLRGSLPTIAQIEAELKTKAKP